MASRNFALWLGYNDAVSWLNAAKPRIFQPTANFGVGLQKFHMIKVMAADL